MKKSLLQQKRRWQLRHHLSHYSKTKTEGDDSVVVVAFHVAKKKRLATAKPKQKATLTLLPSPFVLQPKKRGLLQRYNKTKIEGDDSNDSVVVVAFRATKKKKKRLAVTKKATTVLPSPSLL
jgi:hypothetical protein